MKLQNDLPSAERKLMREQALRDALEALADKMGERCGDHCPNSCKVCEYRNDLRLILVRTAALAANQPATEKQPDLDDEPNLTGSSFGVHRADSQPIFDRSFSNTAALEALRRPRREEHRADSQETSAPATRSCKEAAAEPERDSIATIPSTASTSNGPSYDPWQPATEQPSASQEFDARAWHRRTFQRIVEPSEFEIRIAELAYTAGKREGQHGQ